MMKYLKYLTFFFFYAFLNTGLNAYVSFVLKNDPSIPTNIPALPNLAPSKCSTLKTLRKSEWLFFLPQVLHLAAHDRILKAVCVVLLEVKLTIWLFILVVEYHIGGMV